MQTQTSNALHNAIIEAGGKDRPPMLTPGNYVQWKSRIKRYIDTKPNHELIHYCLKNPPYKYTWNDKVVPVAEGSSETTTERLKQGKSINVQDLETILYWEFGMSQELKTISYHKLYDILKQHQHEFNEIRAERLARTANPLALVAQQQPVYHPQNHPTHYTLDSSTRSQEAASRTRKAIVNSPLPIYDQEPSMVAEDDEMSKDKEIDKLMALVSLSFKKIYKPTKQQSSNFIKHQDNVGTPVVQKSGIQCYNCKEYGHVAKECQKPKRAKDAAYHKEKMLLCKQEEAGFQLNTEQADWRDDTDDEPEDHELEAIICTWHKFKSEHPEQSKSVNDTCLIEQDKHNMIIDSLDMSYDREQIDQDTDDDDDDLANEHDLLASLIEKLKCEIDDSKNRNKFLEIANKALVDKLKGETEDFKTKNKSLESSNNHFKEANNELSKTNQLMYKDLKKFQAELDKYNDVRYASKVEIDCAKAKGYLMSYKMEYEKSFNAYTRKINDLNQTILEMKKELFAHQETIFILSQEKEAQLKFYKTHEDKEIDKVIVIEKKIKDLDNIVYKTSQSVQIMNMLNRNCKTSFAKPEFLKKAQRVNPRLYDIDEVTNLQCNYLEILKKCEYLEKELSKSKMMSKSFEALHKHAINLELDLQQCQEKIKNEKSIKENQSKEFRKEREQYFKIQDLKAQLQDKGIAIRVIPPTIVSKPQLKSNQMEDRVMLNNSQGKKQEVKDHHRNVKFSKNKTSVTACNDSLNAKTSNVNFVCVTCEKCVLNDKNDTCVLHSLNGVNSRTKMPMVVPICTREPKRTVNQSVAKPLRRTVASESTNQKPRHTTRKLYKHVSKACSWWYPKFTPPGYKWKPKSQIRNVNPNKSTCYIRDLKGNDLLTGSRGTDLYSITLQDTSSPNPICLMAKATSSQAWLWHRRLSHLNFDTINLLSKNDMVIGLPKLKFIKDHLVLLVS
nr:integrase, catalytic region, zinc finger, CCHC-type, peptidase aspartic, catalytic [Tanacetum cinerariifolium]